MIGGSRIGVMGDRVTQHNSIQNEWAREGSSFSPNKLSNAMEANSNQNIFYLFSLKSLIKYSHRDIFSSSMELHPTEFGERSLYVRAEISKNFKFSHFLWQCIHLEHTQRWKLEKNLVCIFRVECTKILWKLSLNAAMANSRGVF